MRKLALGIAAAVTLLAASVPAMAQVGFYAGPGGVGVELGAPYGYGYYDYYGGRPYGFYDYGPGYGGYGYPYGRRW